MTTYPDGALGEEPCGDLLTPARRFASVCGPGSATEGIDLCVQLVRADHGSEAAVSVARRMVVAPHRDGGQAQWLERPVPATRGPAWTFAVRRYQRPNPCSVIGGCPSISRSSTAGQRAGRGCVNDLREWPDGYRYVTGPISVPASSA